MRVGFLNNQIDNRGTGNALFDYAHYNEMVLGNQSFIYTLNTGYRSAGMYQRILDRFHGYNNTDINTLDVLYHIKSGHDDGFRPSKRIKYVVHSVFDNQPHGDKYAFVSDWLASRNGGISVPHIVAVNNSEESLREKLGLREDSIVFGRHGGRDSFDLDFVWDAVNESTLIDDNLNFVFLNTEKPSIRLKMLNKQIFFLEDTADQEYKRKFLNTCNAMIHARGRGETFGISCGEFDIIGKPILTYRESPERAHFEYATNIHSYGNRSELLISLLDHSWLWNHMALRSKYKDCTPNKVMNTFREVFLD